MPIGYERSRAVPSARPKRELAPSATTTIRARTVSVTPLSAWRSAAPVDQAALDRGATASVAGQRVAPAFTAWSATISSRSRRRTTYP